MCASFVRRKLKSFFIVLCIIPASTFTVTTSNNGKNVVSYYYCCRSMMKTTTTASISRRRSSRRRLSAYLNFDEHCGSMDGSGKCVTDDDPPPDGYCLVTDDFGCVAIENNETNIIADASNTIIIANNDNTTCGGFNNNNNTNNTCSNGITDGSNKSKETQQQKLDRFIRLELHADGILKKVNSKRDVATMINAIKEIQKQSTGGRCVDLYERQWEPAEEFNHTEASLSAVKNNFIVDNTFSVLQFNALAEGLSSSSLEKKPFSDHNIKSSEKRDNDESEECPTSVNGTTTKCDLNSYGGFNISHPNIALDFSLRRWRILEVLLGKTWLNRQRTKNGRRWRILQVLLGKNWLKRLKKRNRKNDEISSSSYSEEDNQEDPLLFDLIAVQEIDRYRGFFAPVLRLFGYRSLFCPKPRAQTVRLGWYSDGCALFYNTAKFELINESRYKFKTGTQVFIIATLRHKPTNKCIIVAVTHLKASRGENEKIRKAQVIELLQVVEEVALMFTASADNNNGHVDNQRQDEKAPTVTQNIPPIVIMGDFNADPPLVAGLDGCVNTVLDNHHTTTTSLSRFQSAYPIVPPKLGFYTTWKTRGGENVKRVIDYIFHTENGIRCTQTLAAPDPAIVDDDCYPSLRYPSDHISIAAKFELK